MVVKFEGEGEVKKKGSAKTHKDNKSKTKYSGVLGDGDLRTGCIMSYLC